MKKKFLALLLALVMVVGMLPMAAFAAGLPGTAITPEPEEQIALFSLANDDGGETDAQAAEGDEENTDPIKEALGVTPSQGVYTMEKDVTLGDEGYLMVTGNVTIDLNGHTLTGGSTWSPVYVKGGTLTLKDSKATGATASVDKDGNATATYSGGKITSAGFTVYVYDGGNLTVESGCIESTGGQALTIEAGNDKKAYATINGGYIVGQENGIAVFKTAILNVKGGVVESKDNAAISGNGLAENAGSEVTITGGTVISSISSNGFIACGIYFPSDGKLTIDGGEIYANGGAGIVLRGGKAGFTFKGGKITATGTAKGKVGDSANQINSAAVVLDGAAGYPTGDTAQILIQGGEFTSEHTHDVEWVHVTGNTENNQDFTIVGGTFSKNPFAEGTGITKPDGYKYDETGKKVVPEVTDVTVTFSVDDSTSKYFDSDKGAKDLFTEGEVTTNGAQVTVKGTAKYIQDWKQFSSITEETSGNYLPLKVAVTATGTDSTKTAADLVKTVVVKGSKEISFTGTEFFEDGVNIMRLNKLVGNNGLSDSHFQITLYWADGVQEEGAKAAGDAASTSYTTYDIDCSGIILELPAIPSAENGTLNLDTNKEQVATDITNIINATHMDNETVDSSDSTGETPDVDNAKNTVDIPFDATTADAADKTGTVTLPTTVVAALQGGKKEGTQVEVTATVKTDAANVTLSEGAIQKLDSTSNATTIKVEPKGTDDLKSLGTSGGGSGSGTTTDASKLADAVAAAVDVTVKANNQDVFTTGKADSGAPITISIKVNESGSYHVLYFKGDGGVEKMVAGTVEAVSDEKGGYYVPFTTKHLSIYGVMESNPTNDALVKDLEMNSGADDSQQVAGALKIEMAPTADNGLYKATVTGLEVNSTYTVQISRGTEQAPVAPAVIFTFTAPAATMNFSVNAGSVISIWAGAVTINNGVPSSNTSPVTATASA